MRVVIVACLVCSQLSTQAYSDVMVLTLLYMPRSICSIGLSCDLSIKLYLKRTRITLQNNKSDNESRYWRLKETVTKANLNSLFMNQSLIYQVKQLNNNYRKKKKERKEIWLRQLWQNFYNKQSQILFQAYQC